MRNPPVPAQISITLSSILKSAIFANNSVIDVSGEGYSLKGSFSSAGKAVNLKQIELLLRTGLLCNDSKLSPQVMGDPTEIALVVSAEKAGLKTEEINSKFKRVDEIPFDAARKMMSTLNYDGNDYFVFTKGAVENVLKNSFIIKALLLLGFSTGPP